MSLKLWAVGALVSLAIVAVRSDAQAPAAQPAVEMSGMKATMKLQAPLEGFFKALNGKLDLRATEVDFEPGGAVRDHLHFGPGIRRVLAGELTLIFADTKKEQVVRAGEYFYESGDVNIQGVNRGTETAKLLIVELVPASLKGSAMVPLSRRAELAESGARLRDQVCSQN